MCRKPKTVKHVSSVAQASKEKAVKQETLPARPAIWEDTKPHPVSAKIVRQGSMLMVKVRKVAQNVLSIPSCLTLQNRPRQTAHLALQIVRLEY
jgi:hypothetical protein